LSFFLAAVLPSFPPEIDCFDPDAGTRSGKQKRPSPYILPVRVPVYLSPIAFALRSQRSRPISLFKSKITQDKSKNHKQENDVDLILFDSY
jgi:hypothetical protein